MNRTLVSAAAGVAGGALGLWAMKHAMQGTHKLLKKRSDDEEDGGVRADNSVSDESDGASAYMSITGFHAREDEAATGALARGVYERVTGREMDEELEERLSNWVHRGYGEMMGVVYALLASGRHYGVRGGAFFGFLLWAFGDELMVPLLGLSKKPTALPADMHVAPLVAHLAYGAALGAVVQASDRLSDDHG